MPWESHPSPKMQENNNSTQPEKKNSAILPPHNLRNPPIFHCVFCPPGVPWTPDLLTFSEPAKSIKLILPRYCVLSFRFTFGVFANSRRAPAHGRVSCVLVFLGVPLIRIRKAAFIVWAFLAWHFTKNLPPKKGMPWCRRVERKTWLTSWWLNQPLWKVCSSDWVHLPQFSGWGKPPPRLRSRDGFFALYHHSCAKARQSLLLR